MTASVIMVRLPPISFVYLLYSHYIVAALQFLPRECPTHHTSWVLVKEQIKLFLQTDDLLRIMLSAHFNVLRVVTVTYILSYCISSLLLFFSLSVEVKDNG